MPKMNKPDQSWERFNALKIVVGSEVCALYASTKVTQGGRFVYAKVIRFQSKDQALIEVTKSSWRDCEVGKVIKLNVSLLQLSIKLGNFPYGITEEQYLMHERLMNKIQQLKLFDF